MDEVIDDIISMQSNYDDIQAYIDPVQMPNTVSRTNPPTKCDLRTLLFLATSKHQMYFGLLFQFHILDYHQIFPT